MTHQTRTDLAFILACGSGVLAACAGRPQQATPEVAPQPAVDTVAAPAQPPAPVVAARDPELDRRITRLELGVLERDAQIEELQARLDDARSEVVRSMAKLQTLATRAEAASGMAEAEIAQQSLRGAAGSQVAPEVGRVRQLLQVSTAEFNKQNYGGALYLANQAKNLAVSGRARLQSGERGAGRAGETLFALPLKLQTSGRSNVREGPGTGFKVLYTLESGTAITGFSYIDQWVRVTDETGRNGWISQSLVVRRPDAPR